MVGKRLIRRLVRSLAAVAMVAVVGLPTLLACLWREHRTEITFPRPTGHFAGCVPFNSAGLTRNLEAHRLVALAPGCVAK